MKLMKKIILLILVLSSIIFLNSCGNNNETDRNVNIEKSNLISTQNKSKNKWVGCWVRYYDPTSAKRYDEQFNEQYYNRDMFILFKNHEFVFVGDKRFYKACEIKQESNDFEKIHDIQSYNEFTLGTGADYYCGYGKWKEGEKSADGDDFWTFVFEYSNTMEDLKHSYYTNEDINLRVTDFYTKTDFFSNFFDFN